MEIESPCVKICTYEPGKGFCSGCGRTLEEITHWSEFSEAERRKITAGLALRLKRDRARP
ncbi:MAG: DUF1289 domain-containing protein [Rhizomicrobium sp.]